MRLATILPYDNPWVDAAALGLLTIVGLWAWFARNRPAPRPPYEPPSHVTPTRLEPGGRVKKIGVDVHARACVDDEGKVECVCGLDDIAGQWLEANPDMGARDAELLAWAELHGEVSP